MKHALTLFISLLSLAGAAFSSEDVTVDKLVVGSYETNCYLLRDATRRETIVIDPGADEQKILSVATRNGYQLKHILLTHGHFDHVGACAKLCSATGADVWMAPEDLELAKPRLNGISPGLLTRDVFESGAIRLAILKTPGHTPGSVCFRWNNVLFSGDNLFYRSYGKCEDAKLIAVSIKKQLWPLDSRTIVYPGHGASTTIGAEREVNPVNAVTMWQEKQAIIWTDDVQAASAKAKQEKKVLLLLLTVNAWPCARGYCEQTLGDATLAELTSATINCRVDVARNPEFKEKYKVSTPTQLPAFAFLDGSGALLDFLEKPSLEMMHHSLRQVLSGARPRQEYEAMLKKTDKNAKDYLKLSQYLENHNQIAGSIQNLEQACKLGDGNRQIQMEIRRRLLEQYPQVENYPAAIKIADELLAAGSGLPEEDVPEVTFKKGIIFYKAKRYTECLEALALIKNRFGQKVELGNVHLISGLCYLGMGVYDQALTALDQVNGPSETVAKALYLKGYCRITQQQYDEATKDFSRLVAEHPDSEYARQAEDFLTKLKRRK